MRERRDPVSLPTDGHMNRITYSIQTEACQSRRRGPRRWWRAWRGWFRSAPRRAARRRRASGASRTPSAPAPAPALAQPLVQDDEDLDDGPDDVEPIPLPKRPAVITKPSGGAGPAVAKKVIRK